MTGSRETERWQNGTKHGQGEDEDKDNDDDDDDDDRVIKMMVG